MSSNASGRYFSSKRPEFSNPYKIGPSPVKRITPPKGHAPAEAITIATILLRRNYGLYKQTGKNVDRIFLAKLYFVSSKRALTELEAKKAIALIAQLRSER